MPTLCDHVHLPVQSGSARVLKQMAREYTPEWYLERIAWMKAARRAISLSTDIIVGFPGETDDDFIQTMDLLAEVQYDCVFAFKYSARPNTPALVMIDSIPDAEKSKRLQVLLDRQREIQRINYSKHIGEVMEVMVEGQNHRPRPDFHAQQPEQAGECHVGSAHRSGARKLFAGPHHRRTSEQSDRRSGLICQIGRRGTRAPPSKT